MFGASPAQAPPAPPCPPCPVLARLVRKAACPLSGAGRRVLTVQITAFGQLSPAPPFSHGQSPALRCVVQVASTGVSLPCSPWKVQPPSSQTFSTTSVLVGHLQAQCLNPTEHHATNVLCHHLMISFTLYVEFKVL